MQAPFHHSPGGAARPRVRLRLRPTSFVAALALLVTLLAAVGPAPRPAYAQPTTTAATTTTADTTTGTTTEYTVAYTLTPVIPDLVITGDFSLAPAPLTLTALPLTTPPQTISVDAGSLLGLPIGSYGGCRAYALTVDGQTRYALADPASTCVPTDNTYSDGSTLAVTGCQDLPPGSVYASDCVGGAPAQSYHCPYDVSRARIIQDCTLLLSGGADALQEEAVQDTLTTHALADTPLARQRLLNWGRDALRAAMYNRLLGIIAEDPISRTTSEQALYDRLGDELHTRMVAAAEDAQAEYQKWLHDPCTFRPPAPFSYSTPDACLSQTEGALLGLFGAPQPPTLKEFEAYGLYEASPELQDSHFATVTAATTARLAALAAFAAGPTGATITGIIGRTGALGSAKLLSRLLPFAFAEVGVGGVAGGVALAGPIGIIIDAAVTLILQSIGVAAAAKLPGQLQAAVDKAQRTTDLKALFDESSGVGQQELFDLFAADTLPEFDPDPAAGLLPDPLPAPSAAGVAFVGGPQNGAQAPEDTITYKGWNGATHQAYLTDDGWFVDTDTTTGAISPTLSIDYVGWDGRKWTANRDGALFVHDSYDNNTFTTITSDHINYKAPDGHNATARLVARNVPPRFAAGGDVTVDKNSGAYSAAWATGIDSGAPSEAGQTVSFSATTDNPGLFATGGQPAVAPDGTLSFTLAPNAYGAATVTVTAQDNGGTANGGNDTSAPQTFTIGVAPQPAFTSGCDVTVAEDSGRYSKAWATGIGGTGPDSTAGVSFAAAVDHPELFAAGGQPLIDPTTGALSFTPAPNANGSTTVRVTLTDGNAILPGGSHPSVTKTFTLTITPVNDPPHIATYDRTVYVYQGQTLALPIGYLGINDDADTAWGGPPLLPAKSMTTVSGDEPKLGQVAYDPVQGLVYYTTPSNVVLNGSNFGYDAFGFQICDNGFPGSACATQLVTVIILPPNQAPSFTPGGSPVVSAGSGPFSEPWASYVNPNAPGTYYDYNQHVSFLATADNLALFSAQPRIDYDPATKVGTLSFTPAPGVSGTTVVTVTAHDDGGTAYGGVDTSDPVTFTITINAPPLTAAAADATRLYGAANPPFTGTLTGVQNGDNITASYGATATATTPAGAYAITPTLSDPDGKLGAYAVTLISGTLTIAQAPLTVTADAKSMTYGGTVPTFTTSDSGLVGSDTSGVVSGLTCGTADSGGHPVSSGTPVGTYPITCAGGSAANYSLTYVAGALTITPASQTVTFTSTPPNPARAGSTYTVTAMGGASGNPVTFTASPSDVCTSGGTNGATITLVGAGRCTVMANQAGAGNGNYSAAPTVTQIFTVVYPPLYLTLGVASSPAGPVTTGSVVTVMGTLSNHTTAAQRVTLKATLTYVSPSGHTYTINGSNRSFRLAASQTVGQPFSFTINRYVPRGSYTVTLTATDTAGDTASGSASLTVV